MKAPSDAQAALLALIDSTTETIEWQTNHDDGDAYRPSAARLRIERIDREANTSSFDLACGHTYKYRNATVASCIRNGWLSDLHKRTVSLPATKWTRAAEWRLSQLDMTEDGVIALGLWRERKLNAPPAPDPTLDGRDRQIVALADKAARLGFRLAPHSDEAKQDARRLRRAGWVRRGHIGASVSSVVPTAMGVVEVSPEAADMAIEP